MEKAREREEREERHVDGLGSITGVVQGWNMSVCVCVVSNIIPVYYNGYLIVSV